MDPEPVGQELGDQDRVLILFGYLGPLAIVALVASRREFVKWHAKQGLMLWLSLAVLYPLLRFTRFVVDRYFWAVLGEMLSAAVWLVVAGVALAAIICIIRALEGERFRLPLFCELADRL
jgi:uncharacterized membrane protein